MESHGSSCAPFLPPNATTGIQPRFPGAVTPWGCDSMSLQKALLLSPCLSLPHFPLHLHLPNPTWEIDVPSAWPPRPRGMPYWAPELVLSLAARWHSQGLRTPSTARSPHRSWAISLFRSRDLQRAAAPSLCGERRRRGFFI